MKIGDHLVATAQVLLSCLFLTGYFLLVYSFMSGNVRVPVDYKEAFLTLLGVLTAGVGTIMAYWFQRQRPPDSQS